jgi:hypothetical protein
MAQHWTGVGNEPAAAAGNAVAKDDVMIAQRAPAAWVVFIAVDGDAGNASGGGKVRRSRIQAHEKSALFNKGKRLRNGELSGRIETRAPSRYAFLANWLFGRSADDDNLAGFGLNEPPPHFNEAFLRPQIGRLLRAWRNGDQGLF